MRLRFPRLTPGSWLTALGVAWALVAALDPQRTAGRLGGPILALAGLGIDRLGRCPSRLALPVVLAAALGAGAACEPDLLRADFAVYFCYLRSLAFDHDLDFTNEYQHWRLALPEETATGLRRNQGSIGPAVFWAPFYAAAHVYVLADRAVGSGRHAADGFSVPYLRSTLAGTVTAVVVGAWLLGSVLARRVRGRIAILAVLGAIFTSPVLFYAFIQPGMAHGLAFAMACLSIWAWDRARDDPSATSWAWLGAAVGLLVLVRLQAGAYVLLVAPLAIAGLARRSVKPAWLATCAGAALLAVTPQILAWYVLYGKPIVLGPGLRPFRGGGGWLNLASPRFMEVLLSADHGFFAWTPGMIVGIAGLLLGARRWGLLSLGGLLVFFATAWVNGSLAGWNGSDAFGARRFDVIVPFVALGYATLLEMAVRAPLATPALVLAALTLWNVGFIRSWRRGSFPWAAPLETLAGLQARQLRRTVEGRVEGWFGSRGRALAYDYFEGRFFFWNVGRDGRIDLGAIDQPFLAGGWGRPVNGEGPPQFRPALHPESCVRFPLLDLVPLTARVSLRAPNRLEGQTVAVVVNGHVVAQAAVGSEWGEAVGALPLTVLVPGENTLCLRFSEALPERDGSRVAAQVREIRID